MVQNNQKHVFTEIPKNLHNGVTQLGTLLLKVARSELTDFKKKKLFLFEIISRRSEGVSEKIEYVAVSTPRDLSIPALFFS